MISIYIKEDEVQIETINEKGEKTKKECSLESVKNVFCSDLILESPLFLGRSGLVQYCRKENKELFIYIEDQKMRDVKMSFLSDHIVQEQELKVKMPVTLWAFVVTDLADGKVVSRTSLVTLKSLPMSDKEKIYSAPIPNVRSDGDVCWGRESLKIEKSSQALSFVEKFFSAKFNNDLTHYSVKDFTYLTSKNETKSTSNGALWLWENHYKIRQCEDFDYELLEVGSIGEYLSRIKRLYL